MLLRRVISKTVNKNLHIDMETGKPFKNLPPWLDFVKGRDSDMLRMRLAYTEKLEVMHTETMARFSDMKNAADSKRRKKM